MTRVHKVPPDPGFRHHLQDDYAGTRWTRKADGATITIVGDAEPAAGSTRSVRARNEATGRHFWVTPEGIHRKYWQGVEND